MYFSPLVIAVVSAITVSGIGFSLLTNDEQQNQPQDVDEELAEERRYEDERRRLQEHRAQSLTSQDINGNMVGDGQPIEWKGFDDYKQQLADMKDKSVEILEDKARDYTNVHNAIPIIRREGISLLDLNSVRGLHVNLVNELFTKEPDEIIKELKEMNEQEGLLYLHYINRGFESSGFNPKVVQLEQKLRKLKGINFGALLDLLPGINQRIVKLWIGCYSADGKHPYHRDAAFRGDARHIITIGSYQKQFWMKRGSQETGMFLPHGTMVSMDEKASGYSSNIKHSAKGKSDGSWVIVFETERINV